MEFLTTGVCARKINFELEGSKVKSVNFEGGCPGNLIGISQLVVGMETSEIIEKFKNVKCGGKDTSCPAQLAKALEQAI